MKSSLKAATKAESRRMDILKFEVGCFVCNRFAEVHHLLSGGRRISHMHTIPLCPDHHTGLDSIHKRKVWFREKYGTDERLLEITNEKVALFEAMTIGGKG